MFLSSGGALFGVGDEGIEAWITVQRLEIGVLFNSYVSEGWKSVAHGFACA
jgi:hypothetical protein